MHPSVELIPADFIRSPSGVTHLIQGAADETLCGRTPRRGWDYGAEAPEGVSVTCLPCWKERAMHELNARLGNFSATNEVDCCESCGGKFWTMDRCTECGEAWTPEAHRDED